MDIVFTACRFLAGAYFVWSGTSKMANPNVLWSRIMGYKLLGARPSRALASVLPVLEFVLGLFFAAGVAPVFSGGALVVLLGLFTAAMLVAILRGIEADCGSSAKNQKIGPVSLLRNVVLFALVIVGLLSPVNEYPGEAVIIVIGAVIVASVTVLDYRKMGKLDSSKS